MALQARSRANVVGGTGAFNNGGGVFLLDHHLLGAAEHFERDIFELDAQLFGHDTAAGENRDILQPGLAAIAGLYLAGIRPRPEIPELKAFLDFWAREIEGKLHSVVVAHNRLLSPVELRRVDFMGSIH
jgi:hypothetical protein